MRRSILTGKSQSKKYVDTIGLSGGQRCSLCDGRDSFNFQVADNIWQQVVGFTNYSVLCFACFDYLASKKGVKYAKYLDKKEFQFVGKMATISFTIKHILEPSFCLGEPGDRPRKN